MSSHLSQEHEHYQELCAMACLGEISEAAERQLREHLDVCNDCRTMFADMQDLHANWFPQRPEFEIERSPAKESRTCRNALNRMIAEARKASSAAEPGGSQPKPGWQMRKFSRLEVSLAACILVLLPLWATTTGIVWYRQPTTQAGREIPLAAQPDSLRDRNPNPGNSLLAPTQISTPQHDQISQAALDVASKKWQAEKTILEQSLQSAKWQASQLREQVGDLTGANSQSTSRVSELQLQLDASHVREAKIETELAGLKSVRAQNETELVLVRADNQDLRNKLAAQNDSLDKERDLLSAGREVRDLIAARNLHIIDVYDTSGQGKTERAFGRVFFTEGKSLIFYAYDLTPHHPAAKYAYYAWGKRDDKQGGVRKLGIFFNDDQTQKRWVLQINDSQTLATIDSVFVTLERTDDPGTHPNGQQILTAYLGSSPNHP